MKQEIVTVENQRNIAKVEKTSRQRVPWYFRAFSQVEKWWLKRVRGIDPTSERLVRIYTYNDEGMEFDYKVPNFTYDLTGGLYDDFLMVADEVGSLIYSIYGIPGRYFYDVLLTVHYDQLETDDFRVEQRFTYGYKIIRTDNPRCSLGNPKYRKDCTYIAELDSHLTIEGYKLSGNYTNLSQVLRDLATKTVIVHSKSDAKALLKILKFLGVKHAYIGDKRRYNVPTQINLFSQNVYGYQLFREDGETMIDILRRGLVSTDPSRVMDIDEFIVGKTLKARW